MKKSKEERFKIIQEMYDQNKNCKEIAMAIGCSRSTVQRDMAQLGLYTNETEKLNDEIRRLYRQGKSVSQISYETEKSSSYIKTILKKYGAETKTNFACEKDLIDENTVFVEKRKIVLEKIEINGKVYVDITPIFSPR